ncbi:MAG: long-chain fatty acid--CoA ligase [Actinomycetia bacterium]|nr:long-chain fatty acid--CoA ligase [Actinomycetes bacterium]
MQESALTLDHFFRRGERLFAGKEILTAMPDGVQRRTYGEWADRSRRVGGVLDQLGVTASGRVGSFAWNTGDHLDLWYSVPCSGRVLHTLNIRLFPEQLTYIVNHAEDEVIFVNRSLAALLFPLVPTFKTVRHIVVMDDGRGEVPPLEGVEVHDYEALLAGAQPAGLDVVRDENRAAAMCYTSGTTGNPKGVVYSHRSIWLHTMAAMTSAGLGLGEADVALAIVPMFHANAWGIAHAGPASGASLVMPGADLAPASLARLIEEQGVTVAAGVPTIWMGMLPDLATRDFSKLRVAMSGGSALPLSVADAFEAATGLPLRQGWGMTETSPVCSIYRPKSTLADGGKEERLSVGYVLPGVDFRVVDPTTGADQPWDGEETGELQVAGPWIARSYYDDPRAAESFTDDGWLRTGDVARVDPEGYVYLVDRTKDLVKSGGEWISSAELENEIMAHPAVAEAAVIGVSHPKWTERPLACVVLKPGASVTKDEILAFLDGRVAKWWLPDDVVFVDEIPKTSVGKFSKKTLREQFEDYVLPT